MFMTGVIFVGCSKNDIAYDPGTAATVDNPLGFSVSSTFDWNTLQNVNVTVKTDGNYSKYGISLYDENPFTNKEANLLAEGTATPSSNFTGKVEVGKAQQYLFAVETTPDGAKMTRLGTISNSSAVIDFSAVATANSKTRISSPADPVTWSSAPVDGDFASSVPNGAQNYSSYPGNNPSGNFYVENDMTSINADKGNTNIYIKGDNVVLSSYWVGASTNIYVLPGAKVTINSLSLSAGSTNKWYISAGAVCKITNNFQIGSNNIVYNRGTINATNVEVVNNGVLYNQGTINTSNKTSVQNAVSQIINEGNLNTVDIEAAGSGYIYNLSGTVQATGTTSISSTSAFWVNNGQWNTEFFSYTAGSKNIINNCKLTVNNKMTLSLTDGAQYLLVDGGGEVITKDLYMNTAQVNLLGHAIFKVTGTATFGYNNPGRGFQGISTDGTNALLLMNKAVMENANQGSSITYGGNLIVACKDHFAQGNDGNTSVGHWYINYEAPFSSVISNVDNAGITIPSSGTCSDGYIPVTTPADPTKYYSINIQHIYAMEDNWPDYGDYDLNDIIVKLDVKAVSEQTTAQASTSDKIYKKIIVTPTFMATGADNALGAYLQFDNIDKTNVTSSNVESGQSKAVVQLTANASTLLTGNYINVGESSNRSTSSYKTGTVSTITLSSAVSQDDIENGLNFFITVNGNDNGRKEIHLGGYNASTLAGQFTGKYFSGTNIYKAAETNLVWGICLPGGAAYNWPVERTSIVSVNPSFVNWCKSNGTTDTDWYNK